LNKDAAPAATLYSDLFNIHQWCWSVGTLLYSIGNKRGCDITWYDPKNFYDNRKLTNLISVGTNEDSYETQINHTVSNVETVKEILAAWKQLLDDVAYTPIIVDNAPFLSVKDQEKLFETKTDFGEKFTGVKVVKINQFLRDVKTIRGGLVQHRKIELLELELKSRESPASSN
jgi:hypothetical protein